MHSRFFMLIPLLAASACAPVTSEPAMDPNVVGQKMINLQVDFETLDTDHDDLLSRSEVKQAMIRSGSKDTSDARVGKVMDFYDFNKDGKISLREAQSGAVSGPEELIRKVR